MKEEQQYFWVWYWFFAMCFIIWLVCAYPELVAPFVACLAFFLASVVVIVGVAHAFQEGPAPEPQKGWIGEEVEVSEVYPSDFATRAEYEAFKRTSKYVTSRVTTAQGIDFGAIDEEKVREYLERVDKEKRHRRRAGLDLEIDN